ncbi:phytanoyl-CoA dioxygenase family protein [Gemmata sp. JC673]|uniref:Phytanoyl-CoA dioxygenase family protein n=1 Tax=Gemmata algarum TaxID=2975278 RepID=A0ABU5FAL5_9BACT|nr:phytanoyl-CoA dioxygenase family protein [Gemmata algarum]MDY3563777.1 phytanoyl-CoA dioxygenase family protein [Gemmata algarum]
MDLKGKKPPASGRRFRAIVRRGGLALGTVPAVLLLLKPFRFLRAVYPAWIRRFTDAWSAEMLRVYIFSLGGRVYIDQPACLEAPADFAPRVEAPPEYRLSDDQVRSFYENGFLGPFTLCPPEEMAALREEVLRDMERPSRVYGFRTGRDRHLDCESVYRLACRCALTERLAQLMGPNLLMWRSQVFIKPPGAPAVAWHQASTYLLEHVYRPALYPPDLNVLFQLGVWVAFDDVDLANGCLQFVPGSHRRINTIRLVSNRGGFGAASFEFDCPIDPEKVVSMEMKAGQFVIFTEQTAHGSPPNRSSRLRRGMAFRVIPPEVVAYGDAPVHRVSYLNETYDLTRWGTVVLRGNDTAGLNREFVPFPPGDKVDPQVHG